MLEINDKYLLIKNGILPKPFLNSINNILTDYNTEDSDTFDKYLEIVKDVESKDSILAGILNNLAAYGYCINVEMFDILDTQYNNKLYVLVKFNDILIELIKEVSAKNIEVPLFPDKWLHPEDANIYLNAYKSVIQNGDNTVPMYDDNGLPKESYPKIELLFKTSYSLYPFMKLLDKKINPYNYKDFIAITKECIKEDLIKFNEEGKLNININTDSIHKAFILTAFLLQDPSKAYNYIKQESDYRTDLMLQSIAILCDRKYRITNILNNKIKFSSINRSIRHSILEILNNLIETNSLSIECFYTYRKHWKNAIMYLHPFDYKEYSAINHIFKLIVEDKLPSTDTKLVDNITWHKCLSNPQFFADNLDKLLTETNIQDIDKIINTFKDTNQQDYTLHKLISFYSIRNTLPFSFSIKNDSLTDITIKKRKPLSDKICNKVTKMLCEKVFINRGQSDEYEDKFVFVDNDLFDLVINKDAEFLSGSVFKYADSLPTISLSTTCKYHLVSPKFDYLGVSETINMDDCKGVKYSIMTIDNSNDDFELHIGKRVIPIKKSKYQKAIYMINYYDKEITLIDKFIDTNKFDDKAYFVSLMQYLLYSAKNKNTIHLLETMYYTAKGAKLTEDISEADIVVGIKYKEYNIKENTKLITY